ncbi:phage tail protein [Pseudomonas phytophila]|uniref:Phage tail protein n=1 Tax=Pseudomonas phytophila TaxID=2867264 RepID=A0ABY6FHY7_9PSED|nr:phage tail protein [Pseudomonas phytophila]UXZ97505.1 phage tail protein [Pseudomonas phytophila]
MDFPKSVPNVGLVDGRFVDESNVTGQVGSLITADWGNAMTSEIINVIEAAELVPTEGQNDQLVGAIREVLSREIDKRALTKAALFRLSASATLVPADLGLVILDASSSALTVTLPASNAALGVRDVVLRRIDNTSNRLKVQAAGADKIKLHTHLNETGYPFFVLMGAGDWWHLRSDGAGNWWPVGRCDETPLGRIVFDTSTVLTPGGYGSMSGVVFVRSEWPWLWDHAQQSGMLTTDAARVGLEGCWTSGDGASTFRGPECRGDFLRVLDESRGVDPGRVLGSWQKGSLSALDINIPGVQGVCSNLPDAAASRLRLGYDGGDASLYAGSVLAGANPGVTWPIPGAAEVSYGVTRPRNVAYPGRIKII